MAKNTKIVWTQEQDDLIRAMRKDCKTWKEISVVLGRHYQTVIDHGHRLKIERDMPVVVLCVTPVRGEEPLPAGHSVSWGAITRGTILEGVKFKRDG